MTASELLQDLKRRGVTLFVADGKLRFHAATSGAYTDADRSAVAAARPELIRLLTPDEPAAQPADGSGWNEARTRQTVDDLIALRDAIGLSEGYALRQEQHAAADEVDRCWLARDAAGLRRAADAFAASFIGFESAATSTGYECNTPSPPIGRTAKAVPTWDEAEGARLFNELSREVETTRKRFGGTPPRPVATLLVDVLNIGTRLISDHEAEAARGWDALALLADLVPIVRVGVENWRRKQAA